MKRKLKRYEENPLLLKKNSINIKNFLRQTKIYLYFVIFFGIILILLFCYFFIFYRKYQKNTLNNFFNITSISTSTFNSTPTSTSSDLIIPNKTISWENEKLIMHALGEYNKAIYTDSLEALKYWYFENNMVVMEADFQLTRDNHIVLAHDFNHLKSKPNLEEFKNNTKIPGNLTTMTFEDLVIFMEKNKDLYIITDTKYSDIRHIGIEFDEMTGILNRHKGVNERFIIELYNEGMYLFLKEQEYPFNAFLFNLYLRWGDKNNLADLESIFKFCKENNIKGILMFDFLYGDYIDNFSKKYSVPIYLHTVNNLTKIDDR